MNWGERLATPWARPSALYSAPGSLILKLALGEAPDAIPTGADVRRGVQQAANKTGHGPVDRILRRFSQEFRIARLHASATACGLSSKGLGAGHRGFDDLEHAIGLSRTFCVNTEPGCAISELADALRQLEMVESVSPRYFCALPFNGATAQTTAFDLDQAWQPRDLINAPEAMAYEPGDPAVIVAVVDTGVTLMHPELRDHIRPGVDTVQLQARELAAGIELVGDESEIDTNPADEVGHGTSCAGIIGATGQRMPPGLAGECGLLPMRVLGAAKLPGKHDPIGIGAIADIDAGVKLAVDLGAKVLNLSFGTPESALDSNDPIPHADVVQYALARGCVLVAASGNGANEMSYLPAALDGVIAVGSVNAEGKPSAFSTRGDHVALSAPGEQIASTGINGYQLATGTSFAAPFVSAAAALLVSRALRKSHPLDGRDVRRLLIESATPWSDPKIRGSGAGVLDVVAALRLLDRTLTVSDESETVHQKSRLDFKGGP